MGSTNKIELDEFDEIAFGLTPESTLGNTMDNSLQILNSKQPPKLNLGPKLGAPSSKTNIPMDGLFSDEDDDLFPAFGKTNKPSLPTPSVQSSPAVAVNVEAGNLLGKSILKSSSAPKVADKPPSVTFNQNLGLPRQSSELSTAKKDIVTGSAGDSMPLTSKVPIRSSLFKNLATPSWEKKENSSEKTELSPAEVDKNKRSMLFGGSVSKPSATSLIPVEAAASLPASVATSGNPTIASTSLSLGPAINAVASNLLQESKAAEEEDLRRVSGQHEFIRQQAQQAVQLQQAQADQFLQQFMVENKRQLESHLHRIKSGFSVLGAPPAEYSSSSQGLTPDDLSRKVEFLERKLEERDFQIQKYSSQLLEFEDRHREEIRDLRVKNDESLNRAATVHHEFVMGLQSSHEAIRNQYEESLAALREALNAKSNFETVRGSMEQSSQEMAVWRSDFERKQEMVVREKDQQIQMRDRQIAEFSNVMQSQTDNWKAERELLQKRMDQEACRVLKRESDLEEQQYNLQRERMEFESERTRFRAQQTKELRRLEKRLEETLSERQTALENLAEEKHVIETEKRNLKETIRGIEEKYALELKKKQLNLESAMEHLVAEQKLLLEKTRNVERDRARLSDQHEKFERQKLELADRKLKMDDYQAELQRKDQEIQETVLRAAKMKQDGERALNEAKFMDEEHKNRVAKLNLFLEQLRQKELGLMRRAVESSVEGQQRTIHLPNGSMAVLPHRLALNDALRIQLLPNPASDYTHRNWQNEKDYVRNLKSTPWTTSLNR